MSAPERHDERYYEVVKPRSPTERLIVIARDRIYADFLRLMAPQPHETILDVGVSDVVNDAANMLERKDANPSRITAVGLGEGSEFRAAFPQVSYRQIEANARLPFEDGQFDVATSNAVIEHTGSADNQRFFVAELARVAKRVFVSAPNRYFPVEHHTAAPLAHFWRPSFELFCRATGKVSWLDPANLILVGRGDLDGFAPPGRRAVSGYTGVMLGPFSSNMYLALDAV